MTSPLFSQTATFISQGETTEEDDMGEPIHVPEVRVEVPAWYEIAGSTEDVSAAEQIVTGYVLYVPNRLFNEFTKADRVLLDFDQSEYEVVGSIGFVPDGFITEGYCYAKVEKVSG